MIDRDYSKFIQMVDLNRADKKYTFEIDNNPKNCGYAYLYKLGMGVFVLTYKNNRVGVFDIWGNDILIQVESKYKNKHIMSSFLKSGIWKRYTKHLNSISLDGVHIEDVDDYNKKIHLVRDIMKLGISNIDCVIDCVLDIWNYDDKLTFKEEYELRDFARNLNTYHYWDELISMFKKSKEVK